MSELIYVLCSVMSIICAALLLREFRQGRQHILLWLSLSFSFLAINNMVLFVDLIIFPDIDMAGSFWRNLLGAVSGTVLLFGLIWELL